MANKSTPAWGLAVAALFAIAGSFALTRLAPTEADNQPAKSVAGALQWAAAASGRVEPMRGEVRLSAPVPGRVVEIAVAVNDRVRAGDLLLRLDDEEARARVAGADAEAQVRKRERDAEANPGRLALDRRQAEDVVAASERAVANARNELDRAMRARRLEGAVTTNESVQAERNAVTTALEKLEADRVVLRRAQAATGVPLPTRVEAGLTSSRAELTLYEVGLERTRVRAPSDGTVLQIVPRLGETAAASPEQTLIVLGDLSRMRVRAEVEERDVSKARAGQTVIIRSDAYPSREFSGRVASLAKTLAPARLSQRGTRRPNDLDTLEVLIDLDLADGLLPGMRVDVFFKSEPESGQAPAPTAVPATAPVPAKP